MAHDLKTPVLDSEAIAREIDEIVDRTELPRIEAAAAVLRSHGLEVSDLEATRWLTEDEKRRLGAGRSLLDEYSQRETAQPARTASRSR